MKPENPSTTPLATVPRSRLRRWIKRLMWTGLGLLLVLLIFHRPLLRFAVNYGAKSYAKSGGMELSWTLDGSVVSGVDLKDVTVTGSSDSPIRKLKAEHIRAGYGLWRLIKGETGSFADELVMENVDLVMDPAKFKADRPKKEPPRLPKIVLPRLRLQNVNAHIILPGGDVVVRGLNFTLIPDAAGLLEFQELLLPGNLPAMKNVSGQTHTEAGKITFKSLQLLPDLKLQELSVDMSGFERNHLSIIASLSVPGGAPGGSVTAGPGKDRATAGSGEVKINDVIDGIFTGSPLHDATVTLTNITPATLQPWLQLPADLSWHVPEIKATFRGEVSNPRKLNATLTGSGSGITAASVKVDSVQLDAALENGVLTVHRVDLATGENQLSATGSIQMPESWRTVAKSEGTLQGDVRIPQIASIFVKAPPFTGELHGKLVGTFTNGTLAAQANLNGSGWQLQGVPFETVELTATSDGKELNVEKLKALLDSENTIEATGRLGFSSGVPLQASWQIDLPNMERLALWTGRSDTPGPEAGWLKGTGTVAGAIADWRRQDFSKSAADIRLDASGAAWKSGRLESLALEASVAEGRLNVQKFSAVLNERNRVTASGGGTLAPPWEFSAKVDGDLSRLPDLNGWMEAFGANRLVSGKLALKWEGSGRIDDWSIIGGGTANVESLKMGGMNEAASLSLKTSHTGRRADVSVFDASLGQFKVSAPFVLTDKLLDIPVLRVNAGNLPPVEGHVKLPLEFGQENNAASPIAAAGDLDVTLSVKGMDLTEAARAAGLKPPLHGRVDADVKVTGTIRNPAAAIALKLESLSVPDIKQKLNPADGTVNLTLRDGKLNAVAEVNQKPFQTARAVAKMEVNVQNVLRDPAVFLNTPLEASVNLPESDLNGLRQFITGVASMKGRMGVTAEVSGTLAKPNITGSANATATSISFSDPDVPNARDVRLNVRFAGKQMFIDEARALMAGGNLGARGTVDWTDAANPKIDATLSAKEALILRDENMSMRADGTILCRGSLTQAQVTGRVELVRGRVFKEIEFLPLSLPNQLPPAPPAVTVDKSDAPTLPPPFDQWTLSVDIVTRDPVRLLGNVLNGGVVSNLRLTGTGANPVLEGKATLQDARVRLPFSRMTISRGDIIFKKEKPFAPELDVQGDAFINNYQITLNAYGPALDPKLRFSSSPPLSEGEIATLLATGSTSGDLRSSQGEAANRAAFLLLSQAYRKLFRKAGHTRIDRDPPRLTFSFSLLNNAGGTRSVSAVYEITDNLQAVGSISQTGSFRGLLYYLFRFR